MKNYSYSFTTKKPLKEVFELLRDIEKWWSGIYEEIITGKSKKINDEFSFLAGGGTHFSKQKLVELIPGEKIVWQVIESNLSFLTNPKEWEGTKLVFEISEVENETKITFTHEGLKPNIECYADCSNAWKQYLQKLEIKLTN